MPRDKSPIRCTVSVGLLATVLAVFGSALSQGQAVAEKRTKNSRQRLVIPLKSGSNLGLDFVGIPHGRFRMGSAARERAELKQRYQYEPQDEDEHEVEITRDYWLGTTTVTRGQFRAFVEEEGYRTEAEQDGQGGHGWTGIGWEQRPEYTWKNAGFPQTDEHPVVLVSWNDAGAYCDWVKRKTGKAARLPTEAEWERACRGGTTGRYFFGDLEKDLPRYGNVADASFRQSTRKDWGLAENDGYGFTAPVGQYRFNPYGLYDMHGNVWQWCQDWYDKEAYTMSLRTDPDGPKTGTRRVVRGGSWSSIAGGCRAATRYSNEPAARDTLIGFRVCFSADESRP